MDAPDQPAVGVDDLAGPNAPQVLARLRAQQPVTWIPAVSAWLVTSHELAVAVMRDDVRFTVDDPRFSTARVVGPSMLSLDGAAHRRHRSAFAAPFRPRRVGDRFTVEIESVTRDLLDRIRPRGRADLRAEFAGPLSVAIVTSALGLRSVGADTVLAWYRDIVAAVTAITAGTEVSSAATLAMEALNAQVRAGLAAGDSVLRDATATLSDADIVANAAVMMFGGIETTEAMIVNALLHLLDTPAAAAAVRADPALVVTAVEESLRLQPAAAVIDRYATDDVVLGGAAIANGDLVRVSITGANRDPTVFPAPDRFDLTRTNLRSQLAFAHGPHVCIAMDLARLEAHVGVRAVLDSLPGLRLVEPVDVDGLVFRKPAALPVRWD